MIIRSYEDSLPGGILIFQQFLGKSLPYRRLFFLFVLITINCFTASGQTQGNKTTITTNKPADIPATDSTKIAEDAPLDIGEDRGLFILSHDKKMQLRILGSVRYLVVFDQLNLESKNSFSTYEIATGELNTPLPNYYNGLNQTRLGFEVTRRTSKGDIFIRLETDFARDNGFGIRHAYGKYKRFLFGQTWSLFSHLNALPAMVDFAGPTSSLISRTPQIRYSIPNLFNGVNFAVSLEYLISDLNFPDSLSVQTFQLVPDVAFRFDKVLSWGSSQISLIFPTLSGLDNKNNLITRQGWGVSGSIVVNSWKNGKWYVQGVVGRAISRYFNDLSGNGLDVLLDSNGKIYVPHTFGGYATYEHRWIETVYSNFTFGWLGLEQYSFTPPNTFHDGLTARSNTFWDIADGSKIGAEIIWGQRHDNDEQYGNALRFNVLFYYDF